MKIKIFYGVMHICDLCSKGVEEYKTKGGVLKVTWGCIALMKERLYQQLYHLEV